MMVYTTTCEPQPQPVPETVPNARKTGSIILTSDSTAVIQERLDVLYKENDPRVHRETQQQLSQRTVRIGKSNLVGKSRSSSIITATIQDEDSIEPSDDVEDTDPQVEEEEQ